MAMDNTALVSQHLEIISRETRERYQDVIRQNVRRCQGVYAIYHGDKLYYIGIASNLRSRLKAHLRNRHPATRRKKLYGRQELAFKPDAWTVNNKPFSHLCNTYDLVSEGGTKTLPVRSKQRR